MLFTTVFEVHNLHRAGACSELPAVLVTTSNDEVLQIMVRMEESTPEETSRSINIIISDYTKVVYYKYHT